MDAHIKRLCDTIRETGYALHRYLGPGHLEKVYENGLLHRLSRANVEVQAQYPLKVCDVDGTILGEYVADLLVERCLIAEIKACDTLGGEHIAQLLGYLRACRIEHGLLVNFGAPRFRVRKFILTRQGLGEDPATF